MGQKRPKQGGQEVYPKWYRYQEIGKTFDYGSEIPPHNQEPVKKWCFVFPGECGLNISHQKYGMSSY